MMTLDTENAVDERAYDTIRQNWRDAGRCASI